MIRYIQTISILPCVKSSANPAGEIKGKLVQDEVIDGTFDSEDTWGIPKTTADGTSGWDNPNAK